MAVSAGNLSNNGNLNSKGKQGKGTQDAKHPASSLAGPYGHPIHPILVTLPIGAWICSFGFDVASHVSSDSSVFARGAYWLIAIGIVGAVLAALFGLMDLLTIPRGTPAFKTGLTHMALNLATVVMFAVNFAWRFNGRNHLGDKGTGAGQMVLSAVALAALGISGYLGGKMSYRYGVRVVDENTQAEGLINLTDGAPAGGSRDGRRDPAEQMSTPTV